MIKSVHLLRQFLSRLFDDYAAKARRDLSLCIKAREQLEDYNQELIVAVALAEDKYLQSQERFSKLSERFTPPSPPDSLGKMSYHEMWSFFANLFPEYQHRIHLSDKEYSLCTIDSIREFVEWDEVDRKKYIAEVFDCDDYARALAGEFARHTGWSAFPVTDIWGDLYGGHAFCVVVAYPSTEDLTPTVYFVEPQNDVEIAPELVADMTLWAIMM